MSKELTVKQGFQNVLDLSLTREDGAFLCPQCGLLLSPDDETEDNYSILETKVNDNTLDELLVQCNRCGSEIRLVGFSKIDT